MTTITVFVFLLDNLAGFNNALNDTLIQSAKYTHSNETPVIKNCDPFTSDQILSAVSQDLDLVIVPSFRNAVNQLNNDEVNTVFDNSHEVEYSRDVSFDGSANDFKDFNSFYERSFDNTVQKHARNVGHEVKNETKIEFPTNATFLVAIFETLANVTAQTCAGTLLNPHWVLTASNCINILSSLYVNNTNVTNTSHYTIVAGSSNPLVDGSPHNVTTVLFHPSSNSSSSDLKNMDLEDSYLALMRIEPEVEGPTMELMADDVKSGDIMVYGWVLSKNESDYESLNHASTPGQILSAAECQDMYSYKDNDVLCLFSKSMNKNSTQLSSGGPVLMMHDNKVKMLAVVQTDEHLFVSYPLAGHYDWIIHNINNK